MCIEVCRHDFCHSYTFFSCVKLWSPGICIDKAQLCRHDILVTVTFSTLSPDFLCGPGTGIEQVHLAEPLKLHLTNTALQTVEPLKLH